VSITSSSAGRKSIEDWQKQLYQTLGLSPPANRDVASYIQSLVQKWAVVRQPKPNADEIEAYSRDMEEKIQALLKESPPTRFEDLSTYIEVLRLAWNLEEGARNSPEHWVLKRPIFGTPPLGGVNAFTQVVGNEYVVGFSSGLFSFAQLMSRSVAKTVPSTGLSQGIVPGAPMLPLYGFSLNTDKVRESLKHDKEGAKCFTEAILSYVRWGRPVMSNMSTLDPARQGLGSLVYGLFLEFVIAHEYGHILHNHLVNQVAQEVTTSARSVMWDWKKEAEADVAACALMFAAARSRRINLSALLMGIEVFLKCYEMIDKALSVLCVGYEEYWMTTLKHPSARARRLFLHSHLLTRSREFLEGPDADAKMRSALKEAMDFSQVVDLLWEQARPYVWRLYEVGCNPSPVFRRVSDAQQPSDAARLGAARNRLKELSPNVHGTLEKAEELVVSSKRLIRACATALFKEESPSGITQPEIDEAQAAIGTALSGVGRALGFEAQTLGELRHVLVRTVQIPLDPFQVVVSKVALGGAKIEAAGLRKETANELREGARLIHEAGQLIRSTGEKSGLAEHLRQMGEFLGLAIESLTREKLRACWRAAKLAGYMGLLSGECLIRAAIELWRVQLLPTIGKALFTVAEALRKNTPRPLETFRDVLVLRRENGYAMQQSLRRSASVFQNIELLPPDAEARFREAAVILKAQDHVLGRAMERLSESESVIDRGKQQVSGVTGAAETGQIMESLAKTLGEAAASEQQFGLDSGLRHISEVFLGAGSYLATHNAIEAARLIEVLAGKFLQNGLQFG